MKFGNIEIQVCKELGLEFPLSIVDKEGKDVGLGISWLWMLPKTHPFFWASVIHDFEYEIKEFDSSLIPDKRFLRNCLHLSRKSKYLKTQAYVFYVLIRLWGATTW